VKPTKEGRILDEVMFRFGMREIGVKDRHYKLNGKSLWLRGSNLVFEWNWGDIIRGKEIDYLVTEAREMSMNSFRTHAQPPPRLWCDICDEHGTMILAEFPVLYNYVDYRFTPEEYKIWHRNVLTDAAGWMARLWNHPAVIMWVLFNESRNDDAWEKGPFQDFVNALDPTRPTLRTGTTTKENYDVHPCGNVTEPDEGHLQPAIRNWFEAAGNRTTTNTEYMTEARTIWPSRRSAPSTRKPCGAPGSTASGPTCTPAGRGRGLPRVSERPAREVPSGGPATPRRSRPPGTVRYPLSLRASISSIQTTRQANRSPRTCTSSTIPGMMPTSTSICC
jgi:hypothetical protein